MSLFKYFQRKEGFLPTPEQAGLSEKATKAANTAVMEVKSKKRKRYINFTDEERAKVGQLYRINKTTQCAGIQLRITLIPHNKVILRYMQH